MRTRNGFSLPELMVGVAVIGILAAASTPNIGSYLRSRGLRNAVEQMSVHLRLARSKAVLEGNDFVVRFLDSTRYLIIDDDGGGAGIPGATGYSVANRGNGVADAGEAVLGPFELPQGLVFGAPPSATNPFTNAAITAAVSFPLVSGRPIAVFRSNGTAAVTGYVALAPQRDVTADASARTRILEVLRSTGSVDARPAT